jgi:hypothetical protein
MYTMQYKFKDNDALLSLLTALNTAGSNQHFIQMLNDDVVVGRNKLELLNITPKFDEAILAKGAYHSDHMGELYTTVIGING